MTDKIPFQHTTGNNNDYVMTLSQAQAIPYGTCSTASATATKEVTLVNYPATYTPQVGSKVLVKFTNGNTASTQMSLKVGTQASGVKCTCRGVAMTSGCLSAGAIVEFTYTGTEWNTQFVENDSAINSALTNYQKLTKITVTSDINANSYVDEGIYLFSGNGNVSWNNFPEFYYAGGGTLEVHKVGSSYALQMFYPYQKDPYIRFSTYNSGNVIWGSWSKLTRLSELNSAIADRSKGYKFSYTTAQYCHFKIKLNYVYAQTELTIVSRSSHCVKLYIAGGDANIVDSIIGKRITGSGQSVAYKTATNYMDIWVTVVGYQNSITVINGNETGFSLEYVESVSSLPSGVTSLTLS